MSCAYSRVSSRFTNMYCDKIETLLIFIINDFSNFAVIWSLIALKWLLSTIFFQGDEGDDYKNWDPDRKVIKAVLASISLDVLLAGSEIFHKVRLEWKKRREVETNEVQEVEMINQPPPPSLATTNVTTRIAA